MESEISLGYKFDRFSYHVWINFCFCSNISFNQFRFLYEFLINHKMKKDIVMRMIDVILYSTNHSLRMRITFQLIFLSFLSLCSIIPIDLLIIIIIIWEYSIKLKSYLRIYICENYFFGANIIRERIKDILKRIRDIIERIRHKLQVYKLYSHHWKNKIGVTSIKPTFKE